MRRRRFLQLIAAATLAPLGAPGNASARTGGMARWQGTAIGSEASLVIHDASDADAQRKLRWALDELERLEQVFSLYRADSAVARLNRDGAIDAPPAELIALLSEAQRLAAATDGAFDVTVQPLWTAYARHFSRPGADPVGPRPEQIEAALRLVDHRALHVSAARIAFERPGMAVTLNGIAPGFITDRIADGLRASGLRHVLVDLGEMRAVGGHPEGRPWQVGLAGAGQDTAQADALPLADAAVATSSGDGLRFQPASACNHLFAPQTGQCSRPDLRVSVVAPSAAVADALATALCVAPRADVAGWLRNGGASAAHIRDGGGPLRTISA